MNARTVSAGVDVGGTFTDVFVLDEAKGEPTVAKVPSTKRPTSPIGIARACRGRTGDLGRLRTVVHGTTVGTNALLERKGAVTGIITTKGFRDVLEMRRRDRPQTWGLWGTFEPVVSRDRRVEVDERVLADGTVRTSFDPEEVKRAARVLLDAGPNRWRSRSSTRTQMTPMSALLWRRFGRFGRTPTSLAVPFGPRKFASSSGFRPPPSTPISSRRSAGISRGSKKRSRKTAPTAMS